MLLDCERWSKYHVKLKEDERMLVSGAKTATPQAESDNSCHVSLAWFLTADKMRPDELDASNGIILQEIPQFGQ